MKLSRIHRLLLVLVGLLLYTSGVVWIGISWSGGGKGDFSSPSAALQHTLLSIHGIIAMPFLLLLGSLFPVHMKKGWQTKRSVPSGLALVTVNFLLILSAAALYYASGDDFRSAASLLHRWVGMLLPLPFLLHVWKRSIGSSRSI